MSAIGRYNDAKVSELVGPITEAQPYSFIDSLVTPDFVSGSEFPFMADWIAQSSPRGPSSLRPPAQRMASIDANLESASSSTAPGELPSSDTRVDDYRGSQTPVLDFVADSTAAVSRDQFLLVDDNVINLKVCAAALREKCAHVCQAISSQLTRASSDPDCVYEEARASIPDRR